MKILTEKQMIEILENKTFSKQSKQHQKQINIFAFGEEFMESDNKGEKVQYDAFRFVESDEPTLEDDMYELIDDDNIYIQVSGDCCQEFMVYRYVIDKDYESGLKGFDESYSENCGTFNNLEDAKEKALSIWNK